MNVKQITDPKTPIGDILGSASSDGLLVESEGKAAFAILPLNDDLIDHLLEHNPQFIKECNEVRQRMRAGHFRSHEHVKHLLAADEG